LSSPDFAAATASTFSAADASAAQPSSAELGDMAAKVGLTVEV